MVYVTLEEAQAQLPSLIDHLLPGEELRITRGDETVARLIAEKPRSKQPRKPGGGIGIIKIIQEDDAHLEDFKEYMP